MRSGAGPRRAAVGARAARPPLRDGEGGVPSSSSRRGRRKEGSQAAKGRRQVALDAGIGLCRSAPKENHEDERIGATYEKVHQGVLVHPVDLAEKPADPVALYTTLGARAGRKPDLKRHVVPEGVPLHHAVEQPHAAHRHRLHVVAAPVEKRPDEPTALQAVRRGKREAPVFDAGG